MKSIATSSEARIETTTGSESVTRKKRIIPASLMMIIGRKTTIVVTVAMVSARAISDAPVSAASRTDFPSRRWRSMFSTTTTALSTSIPAQISSPIIVTTLIVSPAKYITTRQASRLVGMASVISSVTRKRRMNR